MTGGYIICPQTLSDRLIRDLKGAASKIGTLTGYKDLCDFMLNAAKIGKPIFMSGKLDIQYDLGAYWHVNYSIITQVTSVDNNANIMIILDSKVFLLSITDYRAGKIFYDAINLEG